MEFVVCPRKKKEKSAALVGRRLVECDTGVQVVVVAENLPTSRTGYECRYTSARFAHSTAVIQVDQLTGAGNTALKCETPLSQQLPEFSDRHGEWYDGSRHSHLRTIIGVRGGGSGGGRKNLMKTRKHENSSKLREQPFAEEFSDMGWVEVSSRR